MSNKNGALEMGPMPPVPRPVAVAVKANVRGLNDDDCRLAVIQAQFVFREWRLMRAISQSEGPPSLSTD